MFTKIEIEDLIRKVDFDLKNNSNNYLPYIPKFRSFYNVEVHNTNEYSLAYQATISLVKNLRLNPSLVIPFHVFNIPIKPLYSLSPTQKAAIEKHVGGTKKLLKSSWNSMSVDSFLHIKRTASKIPELDVFIEYKVNDKFKYISLAQDYLKFKIYTYQATTNNVFVYVVFKKLDNYPTIVKASPNLFVRIGASINPTMFSSDDHVMISDIYPVSGGTIPSTPPSSPSAPLSTSATTNAPSSAQPLDYITKVHIVFLKLRVFTSLLFEESGKPIEIEETGGNLEKNFFYLKKGIFKNRVITARLLVDNYPAIKKLYDVCFEKGIISGNINLFVLKTLVTPENMYSFIPTETLGELMKNVSTHIRSIERNELGNSRIQATQKALSTNYKSSLIILVFLATLAKRFNIPLPLVLPNHIQDGNRTQPIDFQKIVEELSGQISEHYWADENFGKIIRISVSLMYFIINLYSAIFDIDENGKCTEKQEYIAIEQKKKIQQAFQDFQYSFGRKRKIVHFLDLDIENQTIELLGEMMNYISADK